MTSCTYEWIDGEFTAWIDLYEPAWNICYSGKLNAIYTDSNYVYAAYSEGLDIIDIFSELRVAYIDYNYGFTSVCGDDSNVYFGTLYDGLFCIGKATISGNSAVPYCLNDGYFSANLRFQTQSNEIKHLFLTNNNLSIVTVEGIDVINFSDQGYRSYTTLSGVTKSFITNKNELYYISYNNEYKYQINKINSTMCDWQSSDTVYEPGKSFMLNDVIINDVFVTENTSKLNNFNTLFVATSDGCYVYDEGTEECEIYYNKGHI